MSSDKLQQKNLANVTTVEIWGSVAPFSILFNVLLLIPVAFANCLSVRPAFTLCSFNFISYIMTPPVLLYEVYIKSLRHIKTITRYYIENSENVLYNGNINLLW